MPDPQDKVEIDGVPQGDAGQPSAPSGAAQRDGAASSEPNGRRKFLSVWFRCCHAYGRMYRNREQTMYQGRCPRCGAAVQARIGQGGTSQRMFEAG